MFFCIPLVYGCPVKMKALDDSRGPCPRCHNQAVEHVKRRTWFEFCYVPLFPFKSSTVNYCSICQWSSPFDKNGNNVAMMPPQQQQQVGGKGQGYDVGYRGGAASRRRAARQNSESNAAGSEGEEDEQVALQLRPVRRRVNRQAAAASTSTGRAPRAATSVDAAPDEVTKSPEPDHDQEKGCDVDYLSLLSTELVSLILHFLSPPDSPDLASLSRLSLVSKPLSTIVRPYMYRNLRLTTRTNAHNLHRALHGNELTKAVKSIHADIGLMSKTSSQWSGWFLYHSSHSLCGIMASCRQLLSLTLFLPIEASPWSNSVCGSLQDLRHLTELTKDMEPSKPGFPGAGAAEGIDLGWRPRKNASLWSVSQLYKPLMTLKSLSVLRICGLCSDSTPTPPPTPSPVRLTEVVLIEMNVTNTDLLYLIGSAVTLKKLTIWRSSLLSKRGLTHVLRRCPFLVELRVGGSWFGAKDDEDTNYPLDLCLPDLTHLKLLHVSGCLISPAALLIPTLNLDHLAISSCPSFGPVAVHAALAKMRPDPAPVRRLTLVDWAKEGRHGNSGGADDANGAQSWSARWRFCVKQTGEAKGCTVDGGLDDDE